MVQTLISRRMEDAVLVTTKHPRLAAIAQRGFTTLAGYAAILRPLPADAACCTGPYGSGYCGSGLCTGPVGANCGGNGYWTCYATTGWCLESSPCWSHSQCDGGCDATCCDCHCWAPDFVTNFWCNCKG